MQLTTRDAEVIFRKLEVELIHSTHHIRGYVFHDGRRILALHYSFGRKPFPGRTSDKFRRSMHLSEFELRQFVECSLTRDEYIALVLQRAPSDVEQANRPV